MAEVEVTKTMVRVDPKSSTRVQIRGWSIEVVSGPDKGKKVTTLDALLRVGSGIDNDLVLTDPTVSRVHAEVGRTPRGLVLKDLDSRNGTWLDGREVMQAFLQPGDKFALGNTKLHVREDSQAREVELLGAESFGDLVGVSQGMRAVFAELRRVATQDTHLLIEGETGTGKELAARAVHNHSARRFGPFRVVDCNLITEEAAELELFGGFDASGTPQQGVFEGSAGGTIFLDEIGELPPAVQPKLLRILDTRELHRAGAPGKALDVRVLASTNRNLDEEVRQGRFRADLYFRLAVQKVRIPPLRARREDLLVLARHINGALGKQVELTPQTVSLFEGYDWPGNVRELRNVLERASLMQETGNSHWFDFLPQLEGESDGAAPSRTSVDVLVSLPYHEAKDRVLGDFERVYFAEIMKESGFDMGAAETKTGLSMQSLYRLLKKNGLRLKDLKNAEALDK